MARWNPTTERNARAALKRDGAVERVGRDRWAVLKMHGYSRVTVRRTGDNLFCTRCGHGHNRDHPCMHILMVILSEGWDDGGSAARQVWRKGRDGRRRGVASQAWKRVPLRAPQLLARLLEEALPVIAPEPVTAGRPRTSLFAVVYQAVMRCLTRRNLDAVQGALLSHDHLQNNPAGPVSPATLSRFLSGHHDSPKPLKGQVAAWHDPDEVLEKLLAVSTWPARPYETLIHPDGTGLTEQHFKSYFDERYQRREAKVKLPSNIHLGRMWHRPHGEEQAAQSFAAEAGERSILEAVDDELQALKPRRHRWTYTEILWTYRYTLIAAIYSRRGPFHEAPWLLPLLDRARLILDVKELGGDKAYDANYIFDYAKRHGIDAQVKVRRPTLKRGRSTHSSHVKKARKDYLAAIARDEKAHRAKANRRNNAETGNHAFKWIVGDRIYSRSERAQRNEVLCMALAYNLTRLVYLEVERDVRVEFRGGVERLAAAKWEPLEVMHRRHRDAVPWSLRKHDEPRPQWAEAWH